jgi:tetratricopeptide (TPR) repeat protein
MRTLFLVLYALLLTFALDVQVAKAQPAVPATRIRVLVTPLQNGAAARSLSALAVGLPAVIAERLEDEPGVEPLNGPLILTKEQVRLAGEGYDRNAANALAASRGATHFLTGRMSGQTWQWTFVIELYEVRAEGPVLVGSGTSTGDLTEEVKTVTGRTIRIQSQARVQLLLAQATSVAFSAGGHSLAPETVKALETPPTVDAFAFLKYSRAVIRYFADKDDGSDDTAIGMAKVAVVIDPAHAEAQRFYAHVLEEAGKHRLARLHYEFAVEKRPKDVRSLVALSKIELAERNPDIARGYLERAAEARPFDGDTHYWLGRSLLALELPSKAIIAFEDARTLWPTHVAARRELATLYAGYRRYRDAAGELGEVVKLVPDDIGSVFLQAACLRAAGDRDTAYDVLGRALTRFPKEARLRKFRGDLRLQAGATKDALREYKEAVRLAPDDARLKAILDGSGTSAGPLGGEELLVAITQGTATVVKMEDERSSFQRATNDAVFDLHLNKEKGCLDGAAASSALLARETGKRHAELGTALARSSSRIAKADRAGESASLTPDEAEAMKAVLEATAKAERDVREMRGAFNNVLLPLYRQYKCETYDGPLAAATLADVAKKDADRRVTLPEVKPPQYSMPFSPQIDPDKGRLIRFNVDNVGGRTEYAVVLDGDELGIVPPGTKMTFFARLGPHRLCLRPKDGTCADNALLAPFLHDGWTIKVRPNT